MINEQQAGGEFEPQLAHLLPLELLEKVSSIPRGKPDTYGATPLDQSAAYEQQRELLEVLLELVNTNVDKIIPHEIREYMQGTFVMRFQGRADANQEKLLTALRSVEDFAHNPIALDMIQASILGHASPAELILVRGMLGMSGIEVGCVSHPYGKRIEEVAVMRQVVSDSIVLLGGDIIDDPEPRYKLKGVVVDETMETMSSATDSQAFLMTRKRDVGRMPDGTIIRERTSFILRGDAYAIPYENLQAIRALDPKSPTWQADVVRVGNLDGIAAALLKVDAFRLVIPVSSTIYAFNPKTIAEIEKKQLAAREEFRNKMEREMINRFPELLSHIDQLHKSDKSTDS